jgi:hypothetical protein
MKNRQFWPVLTISRWRSLKFFLLSDNSWFAWFLEFRLNTDVSLFQFLPISIFSFTNCELYGISSNSCFLNESSLI